MGGFSPRRCEGRRGNIFDREDGKGAKVGYCRAGWFSDPWHGRLAHGFLSLDLASRLRERPGTGADGGRGGCRKAGVLGAGGQ